jgi:Glycosyltransferase family 87
VKLTIVSDEIIGEQHDSAAGLHMFRNWYFAGVAPAGWILLVPVVAIGGFFYCRHFGQNAIGVTLYVEAAQCLIDGKQLQVCNAFYTYPPIVALATIPLLPLPLVLQNLVWYLLTLGGLAGCIVLSARLAQRLAPAHWSPRDLAWLYGLGIVVGLRFIFAAISSQSYDAIVVLLVLAGLLGLAGSRTSRSQEWAGASLACAAALKATPLLFLPYLIYKRHYRAAAAMAIVLVAVSGLPDLLFAAGREGGERSYLLAWLSQVAHPALADKLNDAPHVFWWANDSNNHSLRGLVGMFLPDGSSAFKAALYAICAVYLATIFLLVRRSGNGPSALAVDGSLLLISMLMLSPMSSESHYVALIPALFMLVAVRLKGDATLRNIAGWFLLASFLLINASSRDLVGPAMAAWAKDHRLLVIDVLLFLAPFAYVLHRQSRSGKDARSDWAGLPTPSLRSAPEVAVRRDSPI